MEHSKEVKSYDLSIRENGENMLVDPNSFFDDPKRVKEAERLAKSFVEKLDKSALTSLKLLYANTPCMDHCDEL